MLSTIAMLGFRLTWERDDDGDSAPQAASSSSQTRARFNAKRAKTSIDTTTETGTSQSMMDVADVGCEEDDLEHVQACDNFWKCPRCFFMRNKAGSSELKT